MKHSSLLVAAALAGAVSAQMPAPAPDPADPRTPVPPLRYESAFAGYRPFVDAPAGRWAEVNREVGALRGHAGHLKGAAPPPPVPPEQKR
jgi:hypothetical protein